MTFHYERYITHLARQPWAITPTKLDVLKALAIRLSRGERLSDEEIAARMAEEDGGSRSTATARSDGSVAVIPIVGTIAHRADSFESSSGGTSTQRIGQYLKRATADESVKSILLDISSPGGSVEGVPELAAQVAAAAAVKPVTAIANALSASAAYWIGSQATEFVVTPSGFVGSIGVFMVLVDASGWYEKEGLKINAISAGDHKLEGAPWEALSDESRAFFQGQVKRIYDEFLKAVAHGRGVTVAQVKADFGQGRVFDAKEALRVGMVDRIATYDDTLLRMVKARPTTSARRADAPVDLRTVASAEGADNVDRRTVATCARCNGSGLEPEQYMGDPEGQKPCSACGGQAADEDAAVTEATLARAKADADYATAAIAIAKAREGRTDAA